MESLKHKLHDLKASGNDIHWLDIGCGDGRSLEVLDDLQDRGNIYYHGIDISHEFLDDAQMRTRKYGTLVISDFEGPYEQEERVVSWGAKYLEKFLSNIGGARMSPGFVPSGEFPKELGFYRCYVKKPELDEVRFQKFIEGYGGFMKEKKEDSRMRKRRYFGKAWGRNMVSRR